MLVDFIIQLLVEIIRALLVDELVKRVQNTSRTVRSESRSEFWRKVRSGRPRRVIRTFSTADHNLDK
jgi:hypothetical protein